MAFARARNLPFSPGQLILTGIQWRADIVRLEQTVPIIGDWRVNFALTIPHGAGTAGIITNLPSFQRTGFAPGFAAVGQAGAISVGAMASWGAQSNLTDFLFTKVFLWDASVPGFVDLTAAASSVTVSDLPMPAEPGDILYLGYTTPRIDPAIRYERSWGGVGGTPAVGGGPLIVEYSTNGGFEAVFDLVDGTNAFATRGGITFQYPDKWEPVTVNGQSLYWIALRLTGTPSTPGVGSRMWGGGLLDGVALLANPDRYPRWAHLWQDIDFSGETGTAINARDPLDVPGTIRFRAVRVGKVGNLDGNRVLFRSAVGAGIPLKLRRGYSGEGYSVWKLSNEIRGRWSDVGLFYMPSPRSDYLLATEPIHLVQEWATVAPLSENVSEIHYSEISVFDSVRWHDLLDWEINVVFNPADVVGFHVSRAAGKLTSTIGIAGINTVGQRMAIGLVPYAGGAELQSAGLLTLGSYTGDTWRVPGTTYPYVQQDRASNRGFWLLHPDHGVPADLLYFVREAGLYSLAGDFARADTLSGSGDGVAVDVLGPHGPLFSATIGSAHTVDANTPFTGTSNQPFAIVDLPLRAGDALTFRVASRGDRTGDVTAFRVRSLNWRSTHSRALGHRRPRHTRGYGEPSGEAYGA